MRKRILITNTERLALLRAINIAYPRSRRLLRLAYVLRKTC